ncbi:sensor histidine kinase [Flexivirga sp. ID2601S]|uniref:Sensor histidine kinase n=1 Tax=Flexivirga aerilata TaxID=1656889 RepID=A0A849AUZ6_9MICO|nr:sensor histidine kinase [Flexivirga aerilata]NNG40512.1 sensor histidine kinase [Flexivirga aerilata]
MTTEKQRPHPGDPPGCGPDRHGARTGDAHERRGSLAVMFFWGGIWLFWMIQPFVDAVQRIDTPRGMLGVLVVPAFCVVYLWHFYARREIFIQAARPGCRMTLPAWDLLRYGLMGLLAVACVVTVGQNGYTAAVFFALSALWTFTPLVGWGVVVAVALGYMVLWQAADWRQDWSMFVGLGFGALAITVGRVAGRRQRQLQESQQVNAELMVQQERNRMARDLHDILGHSLTVITVKAELAGRLLDADATERARAEVADLETLSRTALADVRRAVEGYREISLSGELTRAREALAAAGIEARTPTALDQVPADLVELFAWTVRESVTNVLRHSRAQHCVITVTPRALTVADDGVGGPEVSPSGNGLRGLRERANASGAVLITKSEMPHGFSVTVAVREDEHVTRPTTAQVARSPEVRPT